MYETTGLHHTQVSISLASIDPSMSNVAFVNGQINLRGRQREHKLKEKTRILSDVVAHFFHIGSTPHKTECSDPAGPAHARLSFLYVCI